MVQPDPDPVEDIDPDSDLDSDPEISIVERLEKWISRAEKIADNIDSRSIQAEPVDELDDFPDDEILDRKLDTDARSLDGWLLVSRLMAAAEQVLFVTSELESVARSTSDKDSAARIRRANRRFLEFLEILSQAVPVMAIHVAASMSSSKPGDYTEYIRRWAYRMKPWKAKK